MAIRNVGKYRKRGEPNWTQKDCMLHRAACVDCPNNILESQECQVFRTKEVVWFLQLDPIAQEAYLDSLAQQD